MGEPRCVLAAKKVDFGLPITGYLCNVEFRFPVLIGIVFGEMRGRFGDGHRIRTSRIRAVDQLKNYLVFETIGGSRYVVCHWWYENGALQGSDRIH